MDLEYSDKPNPKKVSVSPENNLWRPWALEPLGKTKVCFFCTVPLNDDVNYKDISKVVGGSAGSQRLATLSQDTLIHGISILCDKFTMRDDSSENTHDNTRNLANLKQWALAGFDNIANLSYCQRCYKLLANMVSLHKLILKKQEPVLDKTGQLIVKGATNGFEKTAFSVNAWEEFEGEFIHNINLQIDECVKKLGFTFTQSKTHQHQKSMDVIIASKKFIIAESGTRNCDEDEVYRGHLVSDDACNRSILQPVDGTHQHPTSWSQAPIKGLKRECPPENSRTIEKRIRLSEKENAGQETVGDDVGKSNLINDSNIRTQLKRKLALNTLCGNVVRSLADGQRLPDNRNDIADGTHNKSGINNIPVDSITAKSATQNQTENGHKKGITQLGSRTDKSSDEESLLHFFKPIYKLDASQNLFMFHHVKFQQYHSAFKCLHPNCQHIEPIAGLFTTQFSFQNFRFHVKQKHRNARKYAGSHHKKLYYCHVCDIYVNGRDNLMEHQHINHSNLEMPLVVCEVCGDTMPQCSIVQHVISHKSEEEQKFALAKIAKKTAGVKKDITRPLTFPCSQCNKSFKKYGEFRSHSATHTPIELRRQFNCNVCGKLFSSLRIIARHKLEMHPPKDLIKTLKCKICNKKYYSHEAKKLALHMISHTEEKPCQCSTCGKRFKKNSSCKKHAMVHNE